MNNKGQVTIFIIIALVIVGAIITFLILKSPIDPSGLHVDILPVYNSFQSCIEDDILTGIDVLESQGGYIYISDFEPGSEYMPFSSQLNFLGNPIPYWYYVSGNNVQKEQIPSRRDMEDQLERYLEEKINKCRFDDYYEQGYEINTGDVDADVSIRDTEVSVELDMDISITKGDETSLLRNHEYVVNSYLGKLYNSARKVYDYEQDTLFLENYGVDILRTYAPVDGVEITCSPLTWLADDVFDTLQDAIVENTQYIKSKGGDFSLSDEKNEYYVVDIEEDVRFMASKNWPYSFEVNPSEGAIMMSKPVGNQQGLGVLGFCYVPYHYVYNLRYPIMVQVFEGDEIFQFPLAVVLQGNYPREALDVGAIEVQSPELCMYQNTETRVNVYDSALKKVDAHISYECFGETCDIGNTIQGSVTTLFPQCVNGFILTRAEGFEDGKHLYSTTGEGSVDIILDRIYEIDIDLKLDSKNYVNDAIISFTSDVVSKTIVYPEQKSVELSEGDYEIIVQLYRSSSLTIAETNYEQCIDVPKSGIGGFFGGTDEKCFDVTLPSQLISNALSGGGSEVHYILESDLRDSDSIVINSRGLPVPKTLEQLQDNYILFEDKDLDISFK